MSIALATKGIMSQILPGIVVPGKDISGGDSVVFRKEPERKPYLMVISVDQRENEPTVIVKDVKVNGNGNNHDKN